MAIQNREPIIHFHYIKIGHDVFWNKFFEVIPAISIFLILGIPLLFSFFYPIFVACFIIIYDILWLFKISRYSAHLAHGYTLLKKTTAQNWHQECHNLMAIGSHLAEIKGEKEDLERVYPFIKIPFLRYFFVRAERISHYKLLKEKISEFTEMMNYKDKIKNYKDIYHLIILATYDEDVDILRQAIKALKNTGYPKEKILFVLATEERAKEHAIEVSQILEKEFGHDFGLFFPVMHPADIPSEVKGKGANISYAALKVKEIINQRKILTDNVIVTTLDADTCIHPQYLWKLTYDYIRTPNRKHYSFQPVPIYSNNIWDVPVPMTVISISCSFWQIIQSSRAHLLRNFSVHAQSLDALIDTNFWSRKTIVEDGHQFWRTYMRYDGHHEVIPLCVPVFQDAVLGYTYWQTIRNQYLQLRRWAWGVTDFPYVMKNFIKNKKIPFWQKSLETWRVFEAPFSLATAPLVLTFVAWMPIFLNPNFRNNNILAINLPAVCGGLLTIAMIGLAISVIVSTLLIPPPPPRSEYRRKNKLILALVWITLPVLSIFFSSLPSVDAQIKLARGRYMEIPGFFVTEKIRKNKNKG